MPQLGFLQPVTACRELRGDLKREKRSLACCVGDGSTRLGPGREPLQAVITITLSAAQNRIAKIPVGSEKMMMGSCPLWFGHFRIFFHLVSLWGGAASFKCAKSRHLVTVFLQNQSWLEKCIFRGPDKCTGPTCHTYYPYLYTESQVSTGTASDLWEAL